MCRTGVGVAKQYYSDYMDMLDTMTTEANTLRENTLSELGLDSWDQACAQPMPKRGIWKKLKLVRNSGCEWDSETCSAAARCGHVHILKYARGNGCEWNTNTCSNAARRGHLATLQWARLHGCPWDSFTNA